MESIRFDCEGNGAQIRRSLLSSVSEAEVFNEFLNSHFIKMLTAALWYWLSVLTVIFMKMM